MLSISAIKRDGFCSVTLDYIRFIAALAVVLGHGVSRFFGPFSEVENPTTIEKIFRVIFSGYGSPAVMVFFVLSGLFIGRSVINQVNKNQFNLKDYLARRVIRLWIVLIPALMLTYAVDSLGLLYFQTDAIYQANKIFGSVNSENLSPTVFLSNLFFTQKILTPTLGSNGALWSLTNEFWYYVLFPLLLLPIVTQSSKKTKVIQLSFACLFIYFIGVDISALFLIWLLGVALLFLPAKKILELNHKKLLLVGVSIFVASLLFIRLSSQLDSKLIERIICGICFTIFCFTLINSDKFLTSTKKHKEISFQLASFSYTLYLIHTPLLCFARAIIVDSEGYLSFSLPNAFLFFGVIIFILLISYSIAKVTEFQTHKIYKKLGI